MSQKCRPPSNALRHAICGAFALALVSGCGERATPPLEGAPPGPYRLTLTLSPSPLKPAVPTEFNYRLTHSTSRQPVVDLQIVHERALHTFIVARDFSSFAHIHQEDFIARSSADRAAGAFSFSYIFPRAGHYRVVNEFTHRNRSWTKQFTLTVGDVTQLETPKIDLRTDRIIDGINAKLRVSPSTPVAGVETELVITLMRGAEPVTDLALLLGSEVHVALWRLDGAHFGHTHSYTSQMADMMKSMRHPGGHSAAMMLRMMAAPAKLEFPGPDVPIRYTFPTAGVYQIFIQCAPNGVSTVFPFMVEVAESTVNIDSSGDEP